MTDDVALADDVLQHRLCVLQGRIENMMRASLGLPDRDAPGRKHERAYPIGRGVDGIYLAAQAMLTFVYRTERRHKTGKKAGAG